MVSRKKIVLVQDNREILEIMEDVLQDEGFDVEASLTTKPIEKIATSKPDAIVIDDHIAGERKGSQVIKEIKNNNKTKNVSAVLTSTSNELPKQAKACLADDYIQKPFDLDEMVKVVKKNT